MCFMLLHSLQMCVFLTFVSLTLSRKTDDNKVLPPEEFASNEVSQSQESNPTTTTIPMTTTTTLNEKKDIDEFNKFMNASREILTEHAWENKEHPKLFDKPYYSDSKSNFEKKYKGYEYGSLYVVMRWSLILFSDKSHLSPSLFKDLFQKSQKDTVALEDQVFGVKTFCKLNHFKQLRIFLWMLCYLNEKIIDVLGDAMCYSAWKELKKIDSFRESARQVDSSPKVFNKAIMLEKIMLDTKYYMWWKVHVKKIKELPAKIQVIKDQLPSQCVGDLSQLSQHDASIMLKSLENFFLDEMINKGTFVILIIVSMKRTNFVCFILSNIYCCCLS